VPVKLQHVKGHQDKATPPAGLPYKAQLNILCNDRARNNLETLPLNLCPHPTLPTAYPHLQINDQTIVKNLANYMQEYARLPDYKQYLSQKSHWPNHLTNQIDSE